MRFYPVDSSRVGVEDVWFGGSSGARLARGALTPASWLYGLGFLAYRAVYDLGLKRGYRAGVPVVCVGNLTVGGSGKTPTTLHVADVVRGLGYGVVVSASGYGSPRAEGAKVAPGGPLDAREWGDEPAEMRMLRPDLPLVVGRRRALAARLAAEAHPGSVLVMDDGFQHLPLVKDVALLLDPGGANRRCLPAGPYREPRGSLRRADAVLDSATGGGRFRAGFEDGPVASPLGEAIAGGEAGVLTAVARPERLLATVAGLGGFAIGEAVFRPDHDPLDAPDLLARFAPGGLVLTTAKDWVKLMRRPDVGAHRFGIVRRSARIEPADAFAHWMKARLEAAFEARFGQV